MQHVKPRFKETVWFLDEEETRPYYVLDATGITFADPTYHITRPRGVPYYTLEYVISGTGVLHCSEKTYRPVAGDVWFLPPELPVEYYSSSENPWEKIWFNLGGELPELLVSLYKLHGNHLFHHCEMLKKDFDNASAIVRQHKPDVVAEFAAAIHKLIASLAHISHLDDRSNSTAKQLRQYCLEHWRENIKLAQLSQLIHRSPVQTLRIFKNAFQVTPGQWIAQRRLMFAKQYLNHTSYTLRNIADIIGFKDEYYFANWFKQHTGMAPGQFRKHTESSPT